MRVIAGSARSVTLDTPIGKNTRPTTDKIKETLFNMINFSLEGCIFLDLFAGSGSIGIEALSRGAKKAVFIDNDYNSIKCIKDNLVKTRMTDKASVFKTDFKNALYKLNENMNIDKFDFIFIDPPYDKNLEFNALDILSEIDIISEKGIVIVEQSDNSSCDNLEKWEVLKVKEYKHKKHTFLKKLENI